MINSTACSSSQKWSKSFFHKQNCCTGGALNPKEMTLTSFIKLCQQNNYTKTFLYHQILSYYTWSNNTWYKRKRGADIEGHPSVKFDSTIGRVYSVHPSHCECFFLRLLHEIRGVTSFSFLKTIGGQTVDIYREIYLALNLLDYSGIQLWQML